MRACELRSRVYKQNTISPENAQPILTAVSLSLTLSFFRLDNLQQETATTENVIKPVKCIKQRKSSSSSTSGCSLSNRYFFSVISVKQQRSDCARARSRPPHFGGRKTCEREKERLYCQTGLFTGRQKRNSCDIRVCVCMYQS